MPKQSIPIELGGKTRRLRYDFNAFELIQERLEVAPLDLSAVLGISFADAKKTKSETELADLAKSIDFKRLKFVIWIGLLHEDDSLAEKEVGGWLDLGNLNYVLECFTEAYLSHGEDEEEVKNESSPKAVKKTIPGKSTKKTPTS